MTRLLPRARASHTPLDDHQEFDQDDDTPLLNTSADDEIPETTASYFSTLFHKIRLPQINYSRIPSCRCKVAKRHPIAFDVCICILFLLIVKVVCVFLGYYTVRMHKPAPVIEKSYNAFRIPTHEASLNYEALKLAEKNHTRFTSMKFQNLQWALNNYQHGKGSKTGINGGQGHNEGQSHDTGLPAIMGGKSGGRYSNYKEDDTDILHRRKLRSTDRISKSSRRRRSLYQNSIIQARLQSHPEWKMQVIFLVNDGENIFTRERLQKIHEVEKMIMQHEKYEDFCFKDNHPMVSEDPAVRAFNGCAPLNSLLTYFFPSKDGKGNIFYDGFGENMDKLDSALKLAMTSNHFYYYVDDKVNSTNRKSRLLRTEVLFGSPLKGYKTPGGDEQSEKFKEFVVTYIDLLSGASDDKLLVLYGGNEIFDYEVDATFWNDIKLASYSVVAICLLMLVLTSGSLWLTYWGLASIVLSAPLAIFFYRVVFGVVGLGILNGAAAFVIIGIGVDDVFVFINIFRQASHIKAPRARTLYTIKTAGLATFFTSFTTAAAFAANVASMIPAIHDFGLFMSLIVANCWLTVMLIMPPVLYIWSVSFANCETRIARTLCTCGSKVSCVTLPDDVAHFMDGNHDDRGQVNIGREILDEEDDVPMLSMEPPTQYVDTDTDEPLVLVDPDPLILPDDLPDNLQAKSATSGGHLGGFLQAVLYHYVALPVIKARYAIIGLSVLLLGGSIVLMCQLHTSTKPPQFFKADSNIQRILDLKSKFSTIDTVHCYDCSAIYDTHIGQVKARTQPAPPLPRPTQPQTTTTTTRNLTTTTYTDQPPIADAGPDINLIYPQMSAILYGNGSHDDNGIISYHWSKFTHLPCDMEGTSTAILYVSNLQVGVYVFLLTVTDTAGQTGGANMKLTVANELATMPTTVPPTPVIRNVTTPRAHNAATDKPPNPNNRPAWATVPPAPYYPHQPKPAPGVTAKSVDEDFDVCKDRDCTHPKQRPLLELGATVYVVLGVKSFYLKTKGIGHVMEENEEVLAFDPAFSHQFNFSTPAILDGMRQLCTLCKRIAKNSQLVRNGSAQCLPVDSIPRYVRTILLDSVAECHDLPRVSYIYGQREPAHAMGGLTKDGTAILWMAFAFESTTSQSKSYFEAYKEYSKWEDFIQMLKSEMDPSSPMVHMFQTSEFWPKVLMEIVAVNSAIYSVVLSLIICMAAVMVFTRHLMLMLIILICIAEMVCMVVGVFYLLGWEVGGVEAVSLSILVGSSVDYCVHLVEGYILAAGACPVKDSYTKARQWRTSAAFSHIGVSVLSSALTTIIAAIPLTQTAIQPFAKFGQIIAITTTVCIVYSLTVCPALLSTLAPAFFKPTWKSTVKSLIGTVVVIGMAVLALFIMSKSGVDIPGPNGSSLFPK